MKPLAQKRLKRKQVVESGSNRTLYVSVSILKMPKPTFKNSKSLVEICLDAVLNNFFRNDGTTDDETDIALHPRPFDSLREYNVLFTISVITLIMFYFISTSLICFSSNYGVLHETM